MRAKLTYAPKYARMPLCGLTESLAHPPPKLSPMKIRPTERQQSPNLKSNNQPPTMNEITLIGTIVKPLTYHCTEDGRDLVRLAVRTPGTSERGDRGSSSDHHCHAWGPAALDLHTHLSPGDRIMLRGGLNYRTHRARAGVTRRYPEIRITGYTYLGQGAELPKARRRAGRQPA